MTLSSQPPPAHAAAPALSRTAARMLARAREEWERRDYGAAERALANVLALAPNDLSAIRMRGMLAQRVADHACAIDCFQRVLAAHPEDADIHICLGIALHEHGAADAAVEHLRRACALAPHSVLAWFNLGEALVRQAHTDEAVVALQRAIQIDPAHLSARLSLSKAQASLGEIDAAITGFRDVLRRDPGNAEGWFGLSNLNTVRFAAADIASVQRALSGEGLSARSREQLGFTLGKALESQGDYTQAFEAFRRANASRRQRVQWDAAGERRRVEEIQRVFANATPAPLDDTFGAEVIFIVSIPRSGSTLVEQILASHPQVEGANEINDLTEIIDAETARRNSAYPLWVPDAGAQDWQRLGRDYLARTARWRKTKPRFTDKSLLNWYLVGPALAMLPAARVVIIRRDPVETCLACFRQLFSERNAFACDLDELADYCADFLSLTRFWREKFPERVLDLAYEQLQAEPEVEIRRLLDFCALPFDAACLQSHKTRRAVLSAPSAAQVREPIRRDTARSARYGDKLDPLRARLRAAGIAPA